jgi:hypothetical protein
MEDELYARIYRLIVHEARGKLFEHRSKQQFSDVRILQVYCWAVLHDRPVSWACDARSWSARYQDMLLPSQPTMSRRMKSFSFQALLQSLCDRLRTLPVVPGVYLPYLVRIIDSKPLIVGGFSKDRDAKRGYATGGMARGYKLSLCWSNAVMPEAFCLGPLNQSDPDGAAWLINHLHEPQGYVLADSGYDVNWLHQLAESQQLLLLTPRKKPGSGLGHIKHCPGRLSSIQRLEGEEGFSKDLYANREKIERELGGWTSFGGGLQGLPSWVRRPRRVILWVTVKLVINAMRLCINKGLAA